MSLLDKLIKQEKSRRVVSEVFGADVSARSMLKRATASRDLVAQIDEMDVLLSVNMRNAALNRESLIRELETIRQDYL